MSQKHQILWPNKPTVEARGRCALTVMTKVPRPGQVKTRLCPPLTPTQAAGLNICFLRDIACSIEAAGLRSQGIACYTPLGQEEVYRDVLPDSFLLLGQREGNFGERLVGALDDLFAVGFASVCLINSDSPVVPASSFRRAAEILCQPGDALVLGPSDDGGYYLIGMKRRHRELFEGITWSTEKVFDQTLQRASEIQAEIQFLPATYDVDDQNDLDRLCQDLLGGNEPYSARAPATREFLRLWLAGTIPK